MSIKIKWKVNTAPSGLYRSFHDRSWPDAEYLDGSICAAISCSDAYTPARARGEQKHGELTLRIADHSKTPLVWRKVSVRFNSLSELKKELLHILKKHDQFPPKNIMEKS